MSLEVAVNRLAESMEQMAVANNNIAKVLDVLLGVLLKGAQVNAGVNDTTVVEKEATDSAATEEQTAAKTTTESKTETETQSDAKSEPETSAATTEEVRKTLFNFAKTKGKDAAKDLLAGFVTEAGVACAKIGDIQAHERAQVIQKINEAMED